MRSAFLLRPAAPAALLAALLAGPAVAQAPTPLTCLLAPARTSEVGTDLRAVVTEVAVRRADAVAAGDVLVRLDASAAEAQRRLAQIVVDGLAARMGRSDDLAARDLISRDEIEQLATDLAAARAELARAELDVARAAIRAPFDGVVAAIDVAPGELSGQEPLLTLIETATLHAEMVFLDDDVGALSAGDALRLAVDLVGAEVEARVLSIDPFIDAASNSFEARATVANADGALPAGVTCRVLGAAP